MSNGSLRLVKAGVTGKLIESSFVIAPSRSSMNKYTTQIISVHNNNANTVLGVQAGATQSRAPVRSTQPNTDMASSSKAISRSSVGGSSRIVRSTGSERNYTGVHVQKARKGNKRTSIRSDRVFSRSRMVLLIGLVTVILVGSLGFVFFTRGAGLPNPYPPYAGTLALDDPLSGNTITWFQGATGQGHCEFIKEAYHLYTPVSNDILCTNGSSNFSDFAYQIHMAVVEGDSGGIIFRCDSTAKNCYYFRIGQDGSYELDLVSNGTLQPLKSGSDSVINTGLNQPNEIAVVAKGSTLDLYVNLHKIDSANDSTYTSGQIGTAASSTSDPTDVSFNNARVWKL